MTPWSLGVTSLLLSVHYEEPLIAGTLPSETHDRGRTPTQSQAPGPGTHSPSTSRRPPALLLLAALPAAPCSSETYGNGWSQFLPTAHALPGRSRQTNLRRVAPVASFTRFQGTSVVCLRCLGA